MMKKNPVLTIFLLYALPILTWIFVSYQLAPISFSWQVTLAGLTILFLGSALFAAFFPKFNEVKPPVAASIKEEPKPSVVIAPTENTEPYKEEITALKEQLTPLQEELHTLKEALQKEQIEKGDLKDRLEAALTEDAGKQELAAHKIEGLEAENHLKQQAIEQLENQIHDLRYEIKTLLQLAEVDYSRSSFETTARKKEERPAPKPYLETPVEIFPSFKEGISSQEEASQLLRKCLQIAKTLSAGYRAATSLPQDPYALDLRRLFDELRLETGALIVVYSPKEERLLYASKESKTLLGISPEKFILDFDSLTQDSLALWKSSAAKLLTQNEVSLSLSLKSPSGENKHLDASLGAVPTGVFRNLVIGVIFPAVLFDHMM